MQRELQKQLGPARSRLTLRRTIPALAGALVLAGWVALVAGLLALFGGGTTIVLVGLAVMILLPLAAALAVLLRPASWQQAARAVDRHFRLNDRVGTALHLAGHSSSEPLDALQMEDALARLRNVKARDAVALTVPWQRVSLGLALCGLAIALMAWAIFAPPSAPQLPNRTIPAAGGEDEAARTMAAPIELDAALVRLSLQFASDTPESDAVFPELRQGSDLSNRYFDMLQASLDDLP